MHTNELAQPIILDRSGWDIRENCRYGQADDAQLRALDLIA